MRVLEKWKSCQAYRIFSPFRLFIPVLDFLVNINLSYLRSWAWSLVAIFISYFTSSLLFGMTDESLEWNSVSSVELDSTSTPWSFIYKFLLPSWYNCLALVHFNVLLPSFWRAPAWIWVLFYCNSCAELQVICTVKKHILTGGPKRLPFTVPPLVFSCLKVCLSNSFNKCKMFFRYIWY